MTATRRLAAILAADVAGYSRLMGADEEGTLERLKALRGELLDPKIAGHRGRIVKTTGDGLLVEFASVVDALRCAVEVQLEVAGRNAGVLPDNRIEFRIGINMGDIVVEDGDIFGDGVNVAARLEALAEPGGICVSARVQEDAAGKLDLAFEDIGEQQLKNIARPVRVYRVVTEARPAIPQASAGPPLPDKPSIAVLPFANMSGDPEQEYFADGMVEEIITALSRIRWLFVIARNSSFNYKGRAVDVKLVGRQLGVRYVLEGSVRKAGGRVRITAQLIDAAAANHIWAERYDRELADIFAVQDDIAASVAESSSQRSPRPSNSACRASLQSDSMPGRLISAVSGTSINTARKTTKPLRPFSAKRLYSTRASPPAITDIRSRSSGIIGSIPRALLRMSTKPFLPKRALPYHWTIRMRWRMASSRW
jgi:adenylate cyclase